MNRSLQSQLSRMLGVATVVFGLIATIASFAMAYSEAKEFQDVMLRQLATFGARESHLSNPQTTGTDEVVKDPESLVQVFNLPSKSQPAWLSNALTPGFHTLKAGDQKMRVFVHDQAAGLRKVVAQPTDISDEIAINSALRTMLPLLLLFPVLFWLITRILSRGFEPISKLSQHLDEQSVDSPVPLDDTGLPSEITPFVQAINRMLQRAGLLFNQQKRFIADASHELRSPLTALSIQIQNLSKADTMQEVRLRTEPLQAGVDRAKKLTEQLLDLARIQAGPTTISAVDVSELVLDLLADYHPRAEAKQIDLGLDESARFSLATSPESLRLTLSSILDNAIKYTPAGGEVTIHLAREADKAVIEIIDSGPGIPEEELIRVLDPFYRIPGNHETGSGLGLSIAHEAAVRSGGELHLVSGQPNHGLIARLQYHTSC